MREAKRINTISLIIVILCFGSTLRGQSSSPVAEIPSYQELRLNNFKPSLLNTHTQNTNPIRINSMALSHLGFFCKIENKASAKSQLNVRMRVGDLQYVDKLEMKLPAYRVKD